MPYLKWIDDASLNDAVLLMLKRAKAAKKEAKEDFSKNVTDPFSALFEIAGFETSHEEWLENEEIRKAQKTLQNHIGDFHQTILGNVKGWQNMKTGSVFDLMNEDKKILAEVKNKYNTLSGGKQSGLYDDLDHLISPKASKYKGYRAYYVVIIPKKPGKYDKEFTPSDKEKGSRRPVNKNIREIDGASFYEIVTGYPNAMEEMFDILPKVISDCSGRKQNIKNMEKVKAFFDLAYKK